MFLVISRRKLFKFTVPLRQKWVRVLRSFNEIVKQVRNLCGSGRRDRLYRQRARAIKDIAMKKPFIQACLGLIL